MILNIILILFCIGALNLNYHESKELNKFITYGLLLIINIILLFNFNNFILDILLIVLIILFIISLFYNCLKYKKRC